MLKKIEEFGKYVLIAGFSNVKIEDFEEFFKAVQKEKKPGVEIQFFNAKLVATWQHLYFAALNALTAFKNGENISKSLSMETMLYASTQRQIRKATKLLGVSPSSPEIAVLIIGDEPKTIRLTLSSVLKLINARPSNKVLELTDEKTKAVQHIFGISDLEIKTIAKKSDLKNALKDLVIERMALLATQR